MTQDTQDLLKTIGARIKETRTSKQMSQQVLAEKAELACTYISEIEAGKKVMRVDTICRIAEALEVSTDYLLRPNSPGVVTIYPKEFKGLLDDCTANEAEAILKIAQIVKDSLRKAK